MGAWKVKPGSDTFTRSSLNGVANAGIALPAGMYKIRPSFTQRSSNVFGLIYWRLTGNNRWSEFPEIQAPWGVRQIPVAFEYYEPVWGTPGDSWRSVFYPGSSPAPSQSEGTVQIVVPEDCIIGIQAGASASFSVQAQISIERIL
jgi:hypothetical protein